MMTTQAIVKNACGYAEKSCGQRDSGRAAHRFAKLIAHVERPAEYLKVRQV